MKNQIIDGFINRRELVRFNFVFNDRDKIFSFITTVRTNTIKVKRIRVSSFYRCDSAITIDIFKRKLLNRIIFKKRRFINF